MIAVAREVVLPTYRVIVARGALASVGAVARATAPAHRYAIISDSNVAPRYADAVAASLGDPSRLFTISAGEAQKTRDTWATLTDDMLAAGFARDTTVIALGGGVVGDLAGFVAATFMRGVPVIQVPTSLLAMIDASIGGKTGVDTRAGKNLVGAFHQPAAVIADPDLLRTLPADHLRGGLAEALKHGVIADAEYFATVADIARAPESYLEGDAFTDLVARSVEIKADIVRRDERESGVRKTLNFGHTLGHAIELCSDYSMLHGAAVAAGMVLESALAERIGVASDGTRARVEDAVRGASLPVRAPSGMRVDAILRATRGDKKARAGRVEYALPARIGAMAGADSGWSIAVSDDLVREILV
ncbi:MAG TPA: 3-dehydroquinate synthase [Gemmatimonadaceae bacterium]